MTERYCLHCELGAIVTLRLEEGAVSRTDALGYTLQVAANLIETLPPEQRGRELMKAIGYLARMTGMTGMTDVTNNQSRMRH